MGEPHSSNGQSVDHAGLISRLGLNRSTAALLAAILCIGMGQELWAPFMPKFIQDSIHEHLSGRLTMWGFPATSAIVTNAWESTWRSASACRSSSRVRTTRVAGRVVLMARRLRHPGTDMPNRRGPDRIDRTEQDRRSLDQ
jgi:hypothetical protein